MSLCSHVIAPDGTLLREETLKNRGYIGVEANGGGLALGLEEMWQSFPKALRATGRRLGAVLAVLRRVGGCGAEGRVFG